MDNLLFDGEFVEGVAEEVHFRARVIRVDDFFDFGHVLGLRSGEKVRRLSRFYIFKVSGDLLLDVVLVGPLHTNEYAPLFVDGDDP